MDITELYQRAKRVRIEVTWQPERGDFLATAEAGGFEAVGYGESTYPPTAITIAINELIQKVGRKRKSSEQ